MIWLVYLLPDLLCGQHLLSLPLALLSISQTVVPVKEYQYHNEG